MLSGELACSTRPKFAQELQETRRVSQDAPAMKVIIYFKHVSNDQHIFKNLLYVDGQKPHVYFEYFGSVKIMVDWGKNNLQSKGPSLLKLAYFIMNLNPISPQQQRQQKTKQTFALRTLKSALARALMSPGFRPIRTIHV